MLSCTLNVDPELPEDTIEDELDPKELAEGAISACATLAFIILKISGFCSFKNSYWLVIRNGDERSLQRVKDRSQMRQMDAMFLPAQVLVRVSCLHRCRALYDD